jgi:hypothetical protein
VTRRRDENTFACTALHHVAIRLLTPSGGTPSSAHDSTTKLDGCIHHLTATLRCEVAWLRRVTTPPRIFLIKSHRPLRVHAPKSRHPHLDYGRIIIPTCSRQGTSSVSYPNSFVPHPGTTVVALSRYRDRVSAPSRASPSSPFRTTTFAVSFRVATSRSSPRPSRRQNILFAFTELRDTLLTYCLSPPPMTYHRLHYLTSSYATTTFVSSLHVGPRWSSNPKSRHLHSFRTPPVSRATVHELFVRKSFRLASPQVAPSS